MYDQMEMDMRLDEERELGENIAILLEFAYKQLKDSNAPEDTVKNRYEGYGILSECKATIDGNVKELQDTMKGFLGVLRADDTAAISSIQRVHNALDKLIISVVQMSAQAERINEDIYRKYANAKSGLEELADENMADENMEDEFEEAGNEAVKEEEDDEE